METLEMLWTHRDKLAYTTWVYGLAYAIEGGRLDVVRRLFNCGHTLKNSTTTAPHAAARKGDLEMLEWLADHRIRAQIFTPQMMYSAAAGGQLNVLKWLCENGSVDCNETGAVGTVQAAARCDHLDILRWLHERNSKGFSSRAMDIAATNNHREVAEWYHANRTEGCTTGAMDGAAEYGHLEMVKWLHANRSEGCTKAAMDMAAMNGHLEIVKWLHANRSEGCTTAAMDEAARNGLFEIVKWLSCNRSEGCTTKAMDEAAGHGSLGVMKWFYSNRTEGFTWKAVQRVTYTTNRVAGNGEVMKWLLDHGADGDITTIMNNAALNGNFEVVLALHRERAVAVFDMWLLDSGREFLPWFFASYPRYADSSGVQEEEMFLVTSATRYRDQLISYKTN